MTHIDNPFPFTHGKTYVYCDGCQGFHETDGGKLVDPNIPSDDDWAKFQDAKKKLLSGDESALRDLVKLGATNIKQTQNNNGYTITFSYGGIDYDITYIEESDESEEPTGSGDIDGNNGVDGNDGTDGVDGNDQGDQGEGDGEGGDGTDSGDQGGEEGDGDQGNDGNDGDTKGDAGQGDGDGGNGGNGEGNTTPDKKEPEYIKPEVIEDPLGNKELTKAIHDLGLLETRYEGIYRDPKSGGFVIWDPVSETVVDIRLSGNAAKDVAILEEHEIFQAYEQGFNFTVEAGVYEKDGEYFEWSADKNAFVPHQLEIKEPDPVPTPAPTPPTPGEPETITLTKEPQVITDDPWNNELFLSFVHDNGLLETKEESVVYSPHDDVYYTWDPVNEQLVPLNGAGKLTDEMLAQNEITSARQQGFNFTDVSGIYEKGGVYYQWDAGKETFLEVNIKIEAPVIEDTDTKTGEDTTPTSDAPEIIDNPLGQRALEKAISELNLQDTDYPGVYLDPETRELYVWDPVNEFLKELDLYGTTTKNEAELESIELVQAYNQGFNFTDNEGIYEKDGVYYEWDNVLKKFVETTIDTKAEEPTKPEEPTFVPEPDPIDDPTSGAKEVANRMGLRETQYEGIYQNRNGEYYIWNPWSESMEVLVCDKLDESDPEIERNPIALAYMRGLRFTTEDGVFRGFGKFYQWNPDKNDFVEIKYNE